MMFRYFLLIWGISLSCSCIAQDREPDLTPADEDRLELIADMEDQDPEDDSENLALMQLRKNPVNLNYADHERLSSLPFLNELQIRNFLLYRGQLGKLLDKYELQAVPGWHPEMIRKLLPYIRVDLNPDIVSIRKRFHQGENTFLWRVSTNLQNSKGFLKKDSTISDPFSGSPLRMLLRYTHRKSNLLQYGIVADKDAGERVGFRKGQYGFDFYSLHLFARNLGKLKALALGDFTVHMGQGLIQWQGMAFSKSSMITAIKRQGDVIKPYHSAGEYNFHRGGALVLQTGVWKLSGFISYRKFSANIAEDSATSFITSGLHRNTAEWKDRNTLPVLTIGGQVLRKFSQGHLSLNAIRYHFTNPLTKQWLPYNIYSIRDDSWRNISVDYSYTWKNIHFFGEGAIDKRLNIGVIQGAMLSLHENADFTLLYRNISPGYQSLFSNAFTENSRPSNERGLFTGLSLRPVRPLQIDLYNDIFSFPWLKFGVDFPSGGYERLVSVIYKPVRGMEFGFRWRENHKMMNAPAGENILAFPSMVNKRSVRGYVLLKLSPSWHLRHRVELSLYKNENAPEEQGFMAYTELQYADLKLPLKLGLRLQYFETDGYNSRVYAYETDLPYSNNIPVFYDKGTRIYLNCRYNVKTKKGSKSPEYIKSMIAFKVAHTIHPENRVSGTGVNTIISKYRSSLKLQLLTNF